MESLKSERVWAGGRLWSATRIGVPAGVLFGSIQFAQTGSTGAALFGGVFFAVFFGAVMAVVMWRSWQGAGDLAPADRVAVAGIVRRGEVVDDERLAPAVLDYVHVVRQHHDRDQRYQWVVWTFAGLALILALGSTFGGSVRSASVWWVLTAFWAVFLVWRPRRRHRVLANAARAEDGARRLLSPDATGRDPA